VDARYKPSYTITKEELKWLADRVNILQGLIKELCEKKIEYYERQI